jgi:hypothetical protein
MRRVADEVEAAMSVASVEGRVLEPRSQAQFQEAVGELRLRLCQFLDRRRKALERVDTDETS